MEHTSASKPQKLYYRIQEVSQIAGVKPHVLRYWETEFPRLRPQKGSNDQRRYRQSDIDLVLEIRKLLYEERFTIAGARRQLGRNGNGRSHKRTNGAGKATARKLTGLARRLVSLRKEVVALQAMLLN